MNNSPKSLGRQPVLSVLQPSGAASSPVDLSRIPDIIDRVFAPDGLLVKSGREHRPGQLILARAIAQGFAQKRAVMAEASTGLGKSIAYLSAAVAAASMGMRVVVGVGTNNLIEQIRRDIPGVMALMGVTKNELTTEYLTSPVIKGRSNYVCNQKIAKAQAMANGTWVGRKRPMSPEDAIQINGVANWHYANEEENYDLTLYDSFLGGRAKNLVTNDADGCRLARRVGCAWNEEKSESGEVITPLRCEFLKARRQALKGSIVVTNFDVLFWNFRFDSTMIGQFDYIILDESHEFPAKLRSHLTVEYSLRIFNRLVEKIHDDPRLSSLLRDVMPKLSDAVAELDSALRNVANEAMERTPPAPKDKMFEMLLDPFDDFRFQLISIAGRIYAGCVQIVKAAMQLNVPREMIEIDYDKRKTIKRLIEGLGGAFDTSPDAIPGSFKPGNHQSNFAISLQVELDRYRERSEQNIGLQVIPIGMANYMRQTIHYSSARESAISEANNDPALIADAIKRLSLSTHSDATVIAVSATLTPDGSWDHPKREFAMPDDTIFCQVGSPFDYKNNAVWYIPASMPDSKAANRAAYNVAASVEVRELVRIMGGRALILCSRRADMETARLAASGLGFNVYMQDEAPARELTRRFKADPTSCLIGSKTFGTGFDVPGDALQLVIVWSAPYGKPTAVDELLRQRMGSGKWMNGVYTPAMLLDYRQWVGRLIRNHTDIGVIAFLDQQKYSTLARQLHGAMPQGIPLVRKIESVEEFLNRHSANALTKR